jgi:lysozyme
MAITEAEAEKLLRDDLARFENGVSKLAPQASDNQFAAMVSLAFNVGLANFGGSTLLKKHNAGDCAGAADEFKRWNRAGGKVLPGLVTRRAKEALLYRTS